MGLAYVMDKCLTRPTPVRLDADMDRGRRGNALVLVPFVALHVAALALAIVVPFDRSLLWWLSGSYGVRMFGVTAGYHRYFSHRSYKMGRAAQLAMAVLAQTSGAERRAVVGGPPSPPSSALRPTGGRPLAARRLLVVARRLDPVDAARLATTPGASPTSAGFPNCAGWTATTRCPTLAFGAAVWLLGGFAAFVWGYLVATVLLYHATFAINSLAPHLGLAAVCDR